MSKQLELKRTTQCAKCPWKVGVDPHEIPDGYCETKHKDLETTIAKGYDLDMSKPLVIMACHHSDPTNMQHCVGWLHNQLGEGNNIKLRMSMSSYINADKIKVIGKQHQRFEDTLPK